MLISPVPKQFASYFLINLTQPAMAAAYRKG
jgi:hypothetical protein